MVSHVVLVKPRPDLSIADRRSLTAAFERAIREIPAARGVRVGRRITDGAAYEQKAPSAAEYLIVIDFDDLDGLRTYLRHPAHQELGARFNQSLSSALIYDFEVGGLEELEDLS